jgi:hypothetical protein
MKYYKHKTTNEIIKAERFKWGMEDGSNFKKFLWFTIKQPYIYTTITGELVIENASKNDYVIYYETKERIFKGIYNKKIFKKFFKKLKNVIEV